MIRAPGRPFAFGNRYRDFFRGGHPALPGMVFGDRSRVAPTVWAPWFFDPPQGRAVLGLEVDLDALGTRKSRGASVLALTDALAALGTRKSRGASVLALTDALAALGTRPETRTSMMGLSIYLASDPPQSYPGTALAGLHRPLNGEAANLTITLDLGPNQWDDWRDPPLGVSATARWDGVDVMAGVLTGVTWTADEITVRVEG